MPTFYLRVAVPHCPLSDDDLEHLSGNPEGWKIKTRASGYGSGFQLTLLGDATDEQDAIRRAWTAVNAWLVSNRLTATVGAVKPARGPQTRR